MREILIHVSAYKFEELDWYAQYNIIDRWRLNQHEVFNNTKSEMNQICNELHLEFLEDGSSDFTEVKLNKYQKEE